MTLGWFRTLAALTDLVHVGFMLAWGLGLPLLFWGRFPKLSRAYMWFTLAFVTVTVGSHLLLGECFLTTLARELWTRGAGFRDRVPFTVLLSEWIAGFRPNSREVVLLWELAVFVSSAGALWYWHKTGRRFALHWPRELPGAADTTETIADRSALEPARSPRRRRARGRLPDSVRCDRVGHGTRAERSQAVASGRPRT
jgi:hypothetical protein